MNQPSIETQEKACNIEDNIPTKITIPGTNDTYKIGWLNGNTSKRITRLLLTRKTLVSESKDTKEIANAISEHSDIPYKVAAHGILNSTWKSKLFHWWLWRKLARKYSYSQIFFITQRIYDSIDLSAFFLSMALGEKMMTSMKMMTSKEVGQYAQELELELKQRSSKSSRNTRNTTTTKS